MFGRKPAIWRAKLADWQHQGRAVYQLSKSTGSTYWIVPGDSGPSSFVVLTGSKRQPASPAVTDDMVATFYRAMRR